jgi:U3 small nucleolar RNA-associated protein 14
MSNGSEARQQKEKVNSTTDVEELNPSSATVLAKKGQLKRRVNGYVPTLHVEGSSEEGSDDENAVRLPFAIRDQELIKRAFAGADVVAEFEDEKRQTIQDEDEKVIDNTLPGWGNWVGEGLSKKDRRQNKGRFLTKVEGVKEQDRKDAKLERVIINEKRIKKVRCMRSSLNWTCS